MRSFNGQMNFQFDVIPGSRSKLVSAEVYAPGKVPGVDPPLYTFDLGNDWYDLSTATRSNNGYQYQDAGLPLTSGDYKFVLKFDDNGGGVDRTETITRTFTAETVTAVNAATMRQVILADGSISFYWGLPVSGQSYSVRIRNLAGDREYFSGGVGVDGTTVFADLDSVSAMQVGEQYKWHVRAVKGTNQAQSSAITFLYDPFVDENASGATFGPDSAVLTNTYLTVTVGDRADYAGYGEVNGATYYRVAEAVEMIDGVSCLKVRFQGNGNNPNPDLDPEWHRAWLAQDSDGNVWALQIYDGMNDETFFYGIADAVLWMPASLEVGQIFRQFLGMTTQVLKTDLNVPQLSTGLGPFTGCLQLLTFDEGEANDLSYECPGYNTVKEEWVDATPETGWELQHGGARDELLFNYGAYGLWHYDQIGGWSQLNTVAPGQMVAVDIDNDSQDELAVTFSGYGLWIYDPTSGWTQLNTIAPDNMIRQGNGLAFDYGVYGLWSWTQAGGWQQLNTVDPGQMVAVDIDNDSQDELAVTFSGYGLWIYDSTRPVAGLRSIPSFLTP